MFSQILSHDIGGFLFYPMLISCMIALRKHINCRVGNFSMRPGSIEFQ
jgi:hypothetical protein